MTAEDRVLRLLESLYDAGVEVEAWLRFAEILSDELGGAAIQVSTFEQGWESPHGLYWVGLAPGLGALYEEHVKRGLPWGSVSKGGFRDGFCRTSTIVSDEQLVSSAFYLEWMRPQGLVCEAPLVHTTPDSDRRPGWTMSIYRTEGARSFDAEDLAVCDLLAPHLASYTLVFDSVDRVRRERAAFSEVMDRILNGVLLVDRRSEVLLRNAEARRILDANDGVSLENGMLRLADEDLEAELRLLVVRAVEWRGRDPFGAGGDMLIERPSGRRAYIATIAPLNEAEAGNIFGDEVAVLLIADTEADQGVAAARAQRAYDLTDAETEVIRLLAEGLTVHAVSRVRGVSLNTTRTQLKHLYQKTGSKRQSDLVRVVLATTAPDNGSR